MQAGQVGVLDLDGTLIYIDEVQAVFAGVVALPEQPAATNGRKSVFTAGRVGIKKISPAATLESVVDIATLSERNKNFIDTFKDLSVKHGPNYVDRTPEEQAAFDAVMNPPPKQKREKKEKQPAGPRVLNQKCTQCGEQRGHPKHPGDHEFQAPAAPEVLCAACGQNEKAHDQNALNHNYIALTALKVARMPKESRPPKEPKRAGKNMPEGNVKYRWVQDDIRLQILRGANGKYNEGNSGNAIITLIRNAGSTGLAPYECVGQPKCPSTLERAQLAFGQLLGAGLLEEVK